eukprot:7530035-Pyramimonas_sp.AAC.1
MTEVALESGMGAESGAWPAAAGDTGAWGERAFRAAAGSLARLCRAPMGWVMEAMSRIQRTIRERPFGRQLRDWVPRCLARIPTVTMPAQSPAV